MGPIRARKLTRFAAVAVMMAGAGTISPQQAPVFRTDVKLVRLLVTVKNAAGQLVGSLNKDDFAVLDSGVPQEIALFEHHTEQPLSIALLVDTSASTNKDLKYEVDSAARFLRALTSEGNPRDALSFYTFNQDVTLQNGFTRSPERITRALETLRGEGGTSIYDAICFAADAVANRDGRHVIVLVSDGGDTTSVRTYQDSLRALHLADTVIYSIIVVPITNDAGRNVGGENALIGLSRSTGGKVFFPTVGKALDDALAEILRDLRTQYLIGFYPKGLPESKSKYRTVQLKLKQPDLQAFARGGYYEE